MTRHRGSMSLIAASAACLAVLALTCASRGYAQSSSATSAATAPHFVLSSPDFTSHGKLHRAQANRRCGGRDISPALAWRDPPMGTKSFVLLMHDPDAPQAEGFWHWIVYDIPASVRSLPAGAGDVSKHLMPAGAIQGRSDFGPVGYGGPCPSPGRAHRYYFRIYALPVAKLNVPPNAAATVIAASADATALGRAQLMATYGR